MWPCPHFIPGLSTEVYHHLRKMPQLCSNLQLPCTLNGASANRGWCLQYGEGSLGDLISPPPAPASSCYKNFPSLHHLSWSSGGWGWDRWSYITSHASYTCPPLGRYCSLPGHCGWYCMDCYNTGNQDWSHFLPQYASHNLSPTCSQHQTPWKCARTEELLITW